MSREQYLAAFGRLATRLEWLPRRNHAHERDRILCAQQRLTDAYVIQELLGY